MNKLTKTGIGLLFGGLCCFFSSLLINSVYNSDNVINILCNSALLLICLGSILAAIGLSKKPTIKDKSPKYDSQFKQYDDFINNVYICTEKIISSNKRNCVCIKKDTKELFSFIAKNIDCGYANYKRIFQSKPKPIKTYDELLKNMDNISQSYYPDLCESNMETYFDFLFIKPTRDGETLKKQLLSRDRNIIYSASNAVLHLALASNNEKKTLLQPSFDFLTQIKSNTSTIELGGMFASNNRFLTRALQIIEGINNNECFCHLTFDSFGGNAETYADNYGFILIQPSKNINTYISKGIIKCPLCHKKYQVTEEYTGWHISTRSTFTAIN